MSRIMLFPHFSEGSIPMEKFFAFAKSSLMLFFAFMMASFIVTVGPQDLLRGSPHPVLACLVMLMLFLPTVLMPYVWLSEQETSGLKIASLFVSAATWPIGVLALPNVLFGVRFLNDYALVSLLLLSAVAGMIGCLGPSKKTDAAVR